MASEYMSQLVGDANAQYNRTFDVNSSANKGNALVLADGRSISGGSSRRRRSRARGKGRGRASGSSRSRTKRGGFMGSVINQALVPLTLIGLQQRYKGKRQGKFKGKTYGRKSRRGRRR